MRTSNFFGFSTTAIATAVVMAMSVSAHAADFVANDIAFEGLQRVTMQSATGALPIRVGQNVTDEQLANSIKALYATGQFSNVQADVKNGRVVFYVTERPIIAEVNFKGNRLIPKAGLEEGLSSAGLAVGNPLKQATTHGIETELTNQYITQGYYNADIKVKQTELDGNRVKLDVEFIEGSISRVVDINIVGNHHFSDEEIKDILTLKDRRINPISNATRYTQEKFNASLENLKAKYLNEGFVRFKIDNASLTLNEDKTRVFIEIAITEGEKYQFGKTQFLGQVTYDMPELEKLVAFKAGETYSQSNLDKTTSAIAGKFGDDGYYYAQIRPIMQINDQERIVGIDYYIDPVRPVYVRRINFSGNTKTKDEVLRREMRQLEGALASNQKIQLSRARLLRTGFFKNATVEVKPVPNSPDQVDVHYTVEEQPSGSSTIAAGYSQSGGVTFQLDLSQTNFMGTGNRVNFSFSRSETRDVYSVGVTDPFFTENGVSQSLSAYFRKTKYDDRNISSYVTDSYGASLSYGYPINEHQRISGGLNFDNTTVRAGGALPLSHAKQLVEDGGTVTVYENNGIGFKKDYRTYSALLGWNYSSLDKPVFPTKGMSHDVDLTLGFGDHTYQKAVYTGNIYQPLAKGFILRGYTRLGYGNNLPFYENFYAGGYGSVRGYESSTLGPQSQSYSAARQGIAYVRGEHVGGNAVATFGTELILPLPFKGDWTDQVRPVAFFEGGQVFDTTNASKERLNLAAYDPYSQNVVAAAQQDGATQDDANRAYAVQNYPVLTSNDKKFRFSAGLGVTWYTPIGPLSLSYAKPINSQDNDRTEKVQFQIGSVF